MIGPSGIGTYISELVPRMIAARPDFHFVLLGPASVLAALPSADAPNVRVVALDAPIYSAREQVALALRAPRESTLFWSPHYNIPLAWRGRLLVTVHDLAHVALPQLFGGYHRQLYARFMLRRVSRVATAVITPSEFTHREFQRLLGGRQVKPEVVHNGVSIKWFNLAPTPRPYARPYLLYVGNVKPHKNLGRLLEAFAKLTVRVDSDLLILGKVEGLRTADANVLAAVERLHPRVQLMGAVSQAALEQYLAHAAALVLPSLYEGFGLPPLEAMACGCPAVVARAGALPEVCGDAAGYFDPLDPSSIADAIEQVLTDRGLRERLRCRGVERARRFSWDESARSTLAIVDRVLAA
jgi:glycosyltransferase involved in cell wall biosynthesis